MSNVKVVHETDVGDGLAVVGGKVTVASTQATDAEVAAAIAAQDAAENAAEATAKLRSEFCRRAQQVLSTSAVIECTAQGIKFKVDAGQVYPSSRILVMGAGEGSHAGDVGYFEIQPPAVGTTIYGMGVPDKVVGSDGFIPVAVGHQTLWYRLPAAGSGSGTQGTWHYSVYNGADYNVPEDYIFIAQGLPDGVYVLYDDRHLVMGDNYTDTGWRDLAPHLATSMSNYGNGFADVRFRRLNNRVYLEGLLNTSSTGYVGGLANLPVGFRPSKQHVFSAVVHNGVARIDVGPTGLVQIVTNSGGQPWVSLDGISFDLA